MNNLNLFIILVILVFICIKYTNNIEKFSNFYLPSNVIDCNLYNNKYDCINSYQCEWNKENIDNIKTPFCTGNILAVPKNSFDNYETNFIM